MGYGTSPQIKANTTKIRNKLRGIGLINEKGGYGVVAAVLNAEDADIIRYFKSLAYGLLSYYRCADNLKVIKSMAAYYIKFSLMSTLRVKHRVSKTEFTKRYGDAITHTDHKGAVTSFLSNSEIFNLKKEFLSNVKPNPLRDINKVIVRHKDRW